MKLLAWVLGIAFVLTAMNYNNWKKSDEPVKQAAARVSEDLNPIVNYQKTAIDAVNDVQLNLLKQQEKMQQDAFNAQKVKVYVRAKDTKTCMRELKIDVINNEVAECNRDHYVEVRNDELETFKKEHGL